MFKDVVFWFTCLKLVVWNQQEPLPPKQNEFLVGMKLEAVDKSNPSLIGVATVHEVDKDRIRIEFDGYKGSGYWTTYWDRDLLNAGWCHANGHPLKSPGKNRDISCKLCIWLAILGSLMTDSRKSHGHRMRECVNSNIENA